MITQERSGSARPTSTRRFAGAAQTLLKAGFYDPHTMMAGVLDGPVLSRSDSPTVPSPASCCRRSAAPKARAVLRKRPLDVSPAGAATGRPTSRRRTPASRAGGGSRSSPPALRVAPAPAARVVPELHRQIPRATPFASGAASRASAMAAAETSSRASARCSCRPRSRCRSRRGSTPTSRRCPAGLPDKPDTVPDETAILFWDSQQTYRTASTRSPCGRTRSPMALSTATRAAARSSRCCSPAD